MPLDRSAIPQNHDRYATAGYERRDARVGWIFGIVAFLAVTGLFMHFLLGGFLQLLRKTPAPVDQWQPRVAASALTARGDFPRLQVAPVDDLRSFREREDQELRGYGWVNQTTGIARIPIDQAMDLLLKKGLPTRTNGAQAELGPSSWELQIRRPLRREQETDRQHNE